MQELFSIIFFGRPPSLPLIREAFALRSLLIDPIRVMALVMVILLRSALVIYQKPNRWELGLSIRIQPYKITLA